MASNFSPMYFEQPIVIFDTTQSLNSSTGSFVLYGGVSVHSTYESTGTSSGSIVVSGGMGIQKNLNVGGIQTISNTTESTSTADGALVVSGGVGIAKDLNVGGDATIAGNLYVNGTYTYVNTNTINVEDNTLVLNAGPAGSADAGILIHRSGLDVTGETAITSGSLVAINQTSATLGSDYTTGRSDGYYNGWWISTPDGIAQISSYTQSNSAISFFTTGNTLTTPTDLNFDLYNRSYLAQYYDESSDEIRFAYIADAEDPKTDLENFENYANVRFNSLYAETGISTGDLWVSGNSTIANLAVTDLLVASVSMENAELQSATIGALFVTGASVLHGGVTTGSINVTGASLLQLGVSAGSLNVTGESLLHGAVTAGALNVTGASLLQLGVSAGSLNVTGESWLQGAVTAGALNVTGASLLELGVSAGSLNVTGESWLQGAVTAGALNVTGASLLELGMTGGSLNVTGESWLQGAVTAGALNVTGASLLELGVTTGMLYVTGGSDLTGFLNVSGGSFFQDDLTVTTANVIISTNDFTPILNGTSASGGSIIFNTVDVSPSLGDISRERYFLAANNIGAPAPITSFAFSNSFVRAFDAIVSVARIAGENSKHAYYNLKGIQKNTTGAWVLNSSFVGDLTGITFSINNTGQIQYTSTNITDSVNYINFRALTTSIIT